MNLRRLCNATNLKYLAILLMVCDHIYQMFAPAGAPLWLHYLGRPVFPLLLFLAADSFHYTHDRKKYLTRLLLGSWVMTVSSFLLQNLLPNEEVILMNNAFSTFFVAGLYMLFWDRFVAGVKEKDKKKIVTAVLLCFVPILMAAPLLCVAQLSFHPEVPGGVIRGLAVFALLLPSVLTIEGGVAMMGMGVLFYVFRGKRLLQAAVLAAVSLLTYVLSGGFQWMMVFAILPMLLYNGERGRGRKSFFYVFYPVHIWVLYILATAVFAV